MRGRAGKLAQPVSDSLNTIPGTYRVEEENVCAVVLALDVL